jgi:hypothetical protein
VHKENGEEVLMLDEYACRGVTGSGHRILAEQWNGWRVRVIFMYDGLHFDRFSLWGK